MGEIVSFTAALKKGDQENYLVLANGEQIKLPLSLPYADGEEVALHITPVGRGGNGEAVLAKQILQEILNE